MRTMVLAVALFFVLVVQAKAQAPSSLSLMPMPAHVLKGTGQLLIDPSFSVSIGGGNNDPLLRRAVDRFLDGLRGQTGMLPLDMKVTTSSNATLVINCERASKEVQELGEDESYNLDIRSSDAKLSAPTSLGILRGLQTFLQLVQTTPDGFAVTAVAIQDKPRFPWRGLMIDVSRHFIPLDVLKRN